MKELTNDIRKHRSDPNINPAAISETETVTRVRNFANILLASVLKSAITKSLETLASQLEEYFALLPLPTIAPAFESFFPQYMLGRKEAYRRKLFFEYETVGSYAYDKQNESKEVNGYKEDRKIVIAVAHTLMHQITNGIMMRESHRDIDKELLKPMFFLQFYPRKEPEKTAKETVNKKTQK